MKLFLALGNPGRQYERTRHNVGWWVADHLADVWRLGAWRDDARGRAVAGRVGGVHVRILKPLTYMNLSGTVLAPFLRRPSWSPAADLLVIVDDVALPVGHFRLRARGSAGGHNGLRSVEHAVGGQEYARLRVGIRPEDPARLPEDLADFVLAPASGAERKAIEALLPRLTDAAELWLERGIEVAMNRHNREPQP